MHDITPETFLNTLFPPDLLLPDEMPVVAWPDSFISSETGQEVHYYAQRRAGARLPDDKATYYCVSTVELQRKRQVRKRLEEVRTAMVLVLDDVGTKAEWSDVPPSYVLETSEGNFQVGYLLEPYDVSQPAGQAYFDSVLYSLAEAGLNDPGCRSASRLVRLPGSLHGSGFRADVVEWEPGLVWELEALVEAFGVALKTPRKAWALQPGKYTQLWEVDDPVYRWLVGNWTVYGHNDQWVHIECPWRGSHTDGVQGASSTAYSPADYGRAGVGFKCLHGHCVRRGVDDFLTFIHSEMYSS